MMQIRPRWRWWLDRWLDTLALVACLALVALVALVLVPAAP